MPHYISTKGGKEEEGDKESERKNPRQKGKLRGRRLEVERATKPLNASVIPIPNAVCYLIPLSATAHIPWKVCNLPLT
jgi:hypothetical protein